MTCTINGCIVCKEDKIPVKTQTGLNMLLSEKLSRFSETLKMGTIAARAGIGRTAMSKYIRHGATPGYDKAVAIARALGVSIDWLLDDEQGWPPVYDHKELHHESTEASAS